LITRPALLRPFNLKRMLKHPFFFPPPAAPAHTLLLLLPFITRLTWVSSRLIKCLVLEHFVN
jgi:hypothetical protein